MCFCFYNYDADIDSVTSTPRTICVSPCLATNSNIKPSSLQVLVSPSIPAPEGVSITAIVIPSVLGGIIVFISILVAVTIFIVLRVKLEKKKKIDLLEQDFQRR